MTLQLLRRACLAVAIMAGAVPGCSPGGDESTGVGGVLVVSRVDIEGGNRVVLIGGTRQLQATPRTGTGIAVPGKTVTWSSANPAIAGVSGTGLVTGVASGIVSITAVVDGVDGRIEMDVRQVPVATVQVLASLTTLEAGQTTQLQAVTLDSAGGALTGRAMAWSSSNPAVATVSPQGLVTGVGAGSAILTATSEGRSGSVTLTVTPRPASRLGFVVQPSNATAGMAVTPAIQVALQDAAGNTVTSATGTITLAFAANPGGATLTGVLSAPAVLGVATFPDVRVNRAGPGYTLRATAQSFAEAVSGTFSIGAGAPTALAVAVGPAGGSATGTAFSQQPVIQLRDALGNDARQAGVTVTAVLVTGPGTLNGTTSVVTGSDGRAVFTNLAIVGSIGTYSLQFTATGLTPTSSSPFSLSAGMATQLTFTTAPPGTAVNGQPLGTTVIVQLRDGTGNPVAQAGALVTAAIQSGTGALGGTVVVATSSTGAAAFPGLVITGIVGNFTLRFSAAGVTPAVSNTIALQQGAAFQLTFTTAPGPAATNGVNLTTPIVVQLRDAGGNAVATAGVNVAAGIQAGPGGVLSGTTSVPTNAAGNATFSTLTITGLVGAYTLQFSAASVSPATSNPVTLAPGAATQLAFTTSPPAAAQSGTILSPAPVVQLQDLSNNNVSQAGVAVSVSRVSGDPSVMISGGGVSTNAAGQAVFSALTLTGPADSYVLAFLSAGLTGVTSSGIALTPLAPPTPTTIAANSATSQSATVGTAVAQAPSVKVTGTGGVAVAGVNVTFTVTSGGGTISPASPATVPTDASGIATLSNWTVGAAAGTNSVTATAAGLAGSPVVFTATGTAISATTIAANSATSQSATVGTAVAQAPSVKVTGTGGVAVAGVNVTFTVTSGGGTISPASPATVPTDASGIATLSNWTVGATAGTNSVTATAAGLAGSPVVFTATGTAAAATTIAANSSTSQSATVGTAVAQAPSVKVTGTGGVAVAGVNVTFTVTSGGGTISPASPATVPTDASGIATLSNWTVGATAGTNSVTATAAGLAGSPVVFTATGTAAAATTIAANSSTSQSATVGTAVAQAPSVKVTGTGGVAIAGVNITFTVTSGGGTISPASPATVPTDASGIATLSNWTVGATAGTNSVTATAAGLAGSPVVFTATGTAAAATTIAANSATSQSATVGTAVAQAPSVKVTGTGGVAIAGVNVTFTVTSGGGTIIGATTVPTNSAGIATVGEWILGTTAGPNTLSASVAGLTGSPVNFSATGTAAAPAALEVATQPGGAEDDERFDTQPVIRVVDAYGNLVTTSTASVTAEIESGSGNLKGGTTRSAMSGVVSFTNLRIEGEGPHVLRFTSPGLAPAVSASFIVEPD